MTDYKQTLNLPQTDFPMRGNLPQREPEIAAFWHDKAIYAKQRALFSDKPAFTLHDGPPYANGAIHVGHALNKILKDIITKSHQMLGFNSAYIPGWDCHGLPIEQKVEQKIGKPSVTVSAAEFRQVCRAFAKEQVALQKSGFIRLGILGDWDAPYLTMNHQTEAEIVRGLREIVQAGHVVRDFKPINWCFDCMSSLAEAEVEYADKESYSLYVGFAVQDVPALCQLMHFDGSPDSIDVVIWTTTPWTLPANVAVCVHPAFTYVLAELEGRFIVVAKELLETVHQCWGSKQNFIIHGETSGEKLNGLLLMHPFAKRTVPIINGQHVTLDAGTGAVHTAPAHGMDDYQISRQYQLTMLNFVGSDGVYSRDTPLFAGMNIYKAEPKIIEILAQQRRLFHINQLRHSYPHCWRHKTPTIYRATAQWFISMDKENLRNTALRALNSVAFTPQWGRARLTNMISNRPDWCISRQRYWGVPLCFVIHKETGELHPDIVQIMEKAAAAIAQDGIEAWFNLPLKSLIEADDISQYKKIDDVLDVWFDSGITHYSVLRKRDNLHYPADLYLEGSDQHRGWFHSSLLTGCAIDKKAPYRALLTHGFTVDEHGHKMSKSLGNVVDPEKVVKQLGADILRLWVSSVDYSAEVSLSENILKQRADAYRRIRNTCRFLLANLHDFDPNIDQVLYQDLVALDKYAIALAYELQEKLKILYQQYEFHTIYQLLFNFCSNTMGGFYLDIIKDRQYTIKKNARARRSAQTAIYHILESMVRWFAPILSFTAEEIWSYFPGMRAESVFLSEFYDGLKPLTDSPFSMKDWSRLVEIRDAVNRQLETARNEGIIGSGLEADVEINATPEDYTLLSRFGEELHFALITSAVSIQSASTLTIHIHPATGKKCVRCWHHRLEVGTNQSHPELCLRCVENVEGDGEIRLFV